MGLASVPWEDVVKLFGDRWSYCDDGSASPMRWTGLVSGAHEFDTS